MLWARRAFQDGVGDGARREYEKGSAAPPRTTIALQAASKVAQILSRVSRPASLRMRTKRKPERMSDVPVPPSSPIEQSRPFPSARPAYASWTDAAITGSVGVGAAVVVAIPVALGCLVWLSASGATSTPFGGGLSVGGLGPVAVVLWVAVLSLGGQLSISLAANAFGASASIGSGTAVFICALVFIAAVGTTAWWSHRVGRRHSGAHGLAFWLAAPTSGVTAGVLALLLGVIGQGSISGGPVSAQASALSVGSFFGPFLVISLAAAGGKWLARSAALHEVGFFGALWALPGRLRGGTRDVFDYVAVLVTVFGVTSVLIGLFSLGGALPLALGQLTVAMVCLGSFGGILAQTSVPGGPTGSNSTTLSTFSPEVIGFTWLLLILSLVCALLTAMLVANRRSVTANGWRTVWVLPVFTIVASAALGLLFGTASVSGTGGAFGFTASLSASIAPTWWTYLVAGVWGLGVELLARYVAPVAISAVPALARLRIGAATRTAPSNDADSTPN